MTDEPETWSDVAARNDPEEPEHWCTEECTCWAVACSCEFCVPITTRVDQQIRDERHDR